MKTPNLKTLSLLGTALLLTFASCKETDDMPEPVEQELITTVKLKFTSNTLTAAPVYYTYKVENGFNNTTPGVVHIDTIRLIAGNIYQVEADLYNEKASPADTITNEILTERDDHLFFYVSNPNSGPGTVSPVAGSGSLDFQSKPFNQQIKMQADAAGSSKLRLLLIHEPTNKTAQTPDAAGGETDVDVTFPVMVR